VAQDKDLRLLGRVAAGQHVEPLHRAAQDQVQQSESHEPAIMPDRLHRRTTTSDSLDQVFGTHTPSDQRGQDRRISPVQPRPGTGAPQHRHLVTQDQQLGVFGRTRTGEQHQPTQQPDKDQVQQPQRHGRRSSPTVFGTLPAGHCLAPSSGTRQPRPRQQPRLSRRRPPACTTPTALKHAPPERRRSTLGTRDTAQDSMGTAMESPASKTV
jgi:hypothetical protein